MTKQNIRLSDFLRIAGLLLCCSAAWTLPTAHSQELLVPPSGGSGSGTRGGTLPSLELPEAPPAGSGTRSEGSGTRGLEPIAEPIVSGELQPSIDTLEAGERFRVFDFEPAILESTGTWLRRGFWYAEFDALLLDQIRRSDDRVLAATSFAVGFIPGTTTLEQPINPLVIQGGQQGAEGVPRITLGRFLFRDHKNRDHNAELIAYGGGQWSQTGQIEAPLGSFLSVNGIFDGLGANPSFTGANIMQFDLDSRFNNFELNYHVKSRLQKDRMELEPNGRWVRRSQPSITRSLIAGIRYFDLSEDFNWQAFGLNPAVPTDIGVYDIRTDNDLIGTQIGFTWNYERARWSLGLGNKSGIYWNHANVESSFSTPVAGGVTGNSDIEVDNISFLVEGNLRAKYHIRPNLSLRVGVEALYVSSIAQAPEQADFLPVSTSQVVSDNNTIFMGASLGIEGYW